MIKKHFHPHTPANMMPSVGPGWIKIILKKEIQVMRGTRDRETLQSAFLYSSVRSFQASEVESFTLEVNCTDKLQIKVVHSIAFDGQMYFLH